MEGLNLSGVGVLYDMGNITCHGYDLPGFHRIGYAKLSAGNINKDNGRH